MNYFEIPLGDEQEDSIEIDNQFNPNDAHHYYLVCDSLRNQNEVLHQLLHEFINSGSNPGHYERIREKAMNYLDYLEFGEPEEGFDE